MRSTTVLLAALAFLGTAPDAVFPEQVLERLRDLQVLKKPFLLESLFSQIELVTSAS